MSAWQEVPRAIALFTLLGATCLAKSGVRGEPSFQADLPSGVRAVWGVDKAWRETTPTRDRICLNGLWRWQPATSTGETAPDGGWGWFKVPGPWPGITDYMQKDCQTVIENPAWKGVRLSDLTGAWYEREFEVPSGWSGRRVSITATYVDSLALVLVDGVKAGSISYPAGSVDITGRLTSGGRHRLAMLVLALPLKAAMLAYTDTNHAKEMRATVARRGLCGDVFLVGEPKREAIGDLRVQTSVRNKSITVWENLRGLEPGRGYRLKAEVLDHGAVIKSFDSDPFQASNVTSNGYSFSAKWMPDRLWDIDTPKNQFDLRLSLLDSKGRLLDQQAPKRFGFRELWIQGRDFMLNGTRIFWSCLPLENGAVSAGLASYQGARESLLRLKQIGVNMVYTNNYDCDPGSFLSFDEILRAADDVGMLVALTQPHFSDYEWDAPDADATNGYERHARFFVSVAGSHPSVIAYATSHNATGYSEDMNPDLIDGLPYAGKDAWSSNNVKKAARAEAIIERLDPTRFTYHHSSGNFGSIYSMNFYLNWVPIQELDDWFGHWAKAGVKPVVTIEYGVPFSWDWTMYRGWYKGERSFGSAQVPWEYCMAEWNAQFLGDQAYNISDQEKANLRFEAPKFRRNEVWFRWDYPYPPGSTDPGFEDQQRVWAKYTTDNWRAFRTWGVSGTSPWEISGTFWRVDPKANRGRVDLPTDWDAPQRPGYSPDYVDGRYERRDLAYERSDWIPTVAGRSLLRNNQPLLAYIAGKPGDFTEKGHNFRTGDTVRKQFVVINNSRRTVTCRCRLNSATSMPAIQVPTGTIRQIPVTLRLPASTPPGRYRILGLADFGPAGTQEDDFWINVLPTLPKVRPMAATAIYDPAGETTRMLASLGVKATSNEVPRVLIIGKDALTVDGPGPDLTAVRKGLRVIVFEQSSQVLEQRFGFRVQEYGLRNAFIRVPGHRILAGLDDDDLRDWHGSATLLPTKLDYQAAAKFYGVPAVVRNGILDPHVWRCGNRGNVASVLIEKPACGDFLPLVDGGFSLEYTPLMEYREGRGLVIFCQMDVTGRTASDPAAERLVANLLSYVENWQPEAERSLVYAGNDAGRRHLEASGFTVSTFDGDLRAGQVLALGPGAGAVLASRRDKVAKWLADGGRAIAIGLDSSELRQALGLDEPMESREYINSVFSAVPSGRVFQGIGAADVYSREPRTLPLVADGPCPALASRGNVVLFQLAPWTYDVGHQNTKRTFRHLSFALSRLLGNLGVSAATPLLDRFAEPVAKGTDERRWLRGFYLDRPEDIDDPYRFFGW